MNEQSIEDLSIFAHCLKNLSIPYFLTNGTLLGCIRNQSFIDWDEDIDVDTTQNLLKGRIDCLARKLHQNGFSGKVYATRDFPKITCKRSERRISFGGFKEHKNTFYRSKYFYPKIYFGDPSFSGREESLYGQRFLVPKKSEELLEWLYGDWNVEINSSDEDHYSTKNHYITPSLRRKIRTLKYHFYSMRTEDNF
jgi:phosphorylcholine metabolism protein LicD